MRQARDGSSISPETRLMCMDGDEQALLAYLMTEADACEKYLHRVSQDVFFNPVHRKIIGAIHDLYDLREKINLITVSNRLRDKRQLKECGGRANISAISVVITTEDIAESALDSMLHAYREREAMRIFKDGAAGKISADEAVERLGAVRCSGKNGSGLPTATNLIGLADTDPAIFEIDNLLGNRFLCVEGGMLIVGPSGIGKSSANVQQDILWSLGRPAFGVKPSRPLRILCVQAENDDGDLAEMTRGICDHLKLTAEERRQVGENVIYIKEKSKTGDAFLRQLRRLVQKYRPDIIRIDPLHAYAGGDVRDPAVTTPFLRNGLNPLLTEFHCAAVICHHTPKTTNRDTTKWNESDWMYAGSGNADVTNWARAILVIDATRVHGAFVFRAAKRGSRIGWADDDGHRVYDRLFCHHAGDAIFWRDAGDDDTEAVMLAKAKRGEPLKTKEELKALVPFDEEIPKLALVERANIKGFGLNHAKRLLADLIADKELHEVRRPRKGTCPEVWISRREQVLI
jgi:AAA domain/DnaB-like helicase N terminal domain